MLLRRPPVASDPLRFFRPRIASVFSRVSLAEGRLAGSRFETGGRGHQRRLPSIMFHRRPAGAEQRWRDHALHGARTALDTASAQLIDDDDGVSFGDTLEQLSGKRFIWPLEAPRPLANLLPLHRADEQRLTVLRCTSSSFPMLLVPCPRALRRRMALTMSGSSIEASTASTSPVFDKTTSCSDAQGWSLFSGGTGPILLTAYTTTTSCKRGPHDLKSKHYIVADIAGTSWVSRRSPASYVDTLRRSNVLRLGRNAPRDHWGPS